MKANAALIFNEWLTCFLLVNVPEQKLCGVSISMVNTKKIIERIIHFMKIQWIYLLHKMHKWNIIISIITNSYQVGW